jgi:hypothetical protein
MPGRVLRLMPAAIDLRRKFARLQANEPDSKTTRRVDSIVVRVNKRKLSILRFDLNRADPNFDAERSVNR